jgi:predicted DNA-binding transcriptional regulator AlpA
VTAMTWYSVHIEARGDYPFTITDDSIGELADMLGAHAGVVSGGGGRPTWGGTISVESATALGAVNAGAAIVTVAAEKARLPDWPIVRAEAVREDVLDEDLERPQIPDLVSGPEVAEILGITNQRVHQLAAENARFPRPAIQRRGATLWLRAAIEKFDAEWERKPGRPRKDRDVA